MKEFIMKYWLEVVFGIAITGLSFCIKALQKKLKEQESIKDGVMAILHDRLFQLGMYHIRKDCISLTELKNCESLYTAYHNLGGNGTGTEIYERIKELPIDNGEGE